MKIRIYEITNLLNEFTFDYRCEFTFDYRYEFTFEITNLHLNLHLNLQFFVITKNFTAGLTLPYY